LDGEGRPFLVSGIFRDITSFKSAQLEAKQLTERVLSIQEEERERIARQRSTSVRLASTCIGQAKRHVFENLRRN
jgi:signal transduction histidine kinase